MMKDPKRQAVGRRSRRKGSSNEREVAKLLKGWWGSGEWMRTPVSGGWGRSKQVREDYGAAGDVVTTATDFPFLVEIKAQEKGGLEQLLKSPSTCLISKWWDQTVEETPEGKYPLLLFTRNHQPWYAMLDHLVLASKLWTSAVSTGRPIWPVYVSQMRVTYLTLLDTLMSLSKETVLAAISATIPSVAVARRPMRG